MGVAAIYLGLLFLAAFTAYAFRGIGLALPELHTVVPMTDARVQIDPGLWQVPDGLASIGFANQDGFADDCGATFACLVDDDAEGYVEERLTWRRRVVDTGAMVCVSTAPDPTNEPDLSFAIRFHVGDAGEGGTNSRLTAQAGHSSDYVRLSGEHPSASHLSWRDDEQFCHIVLAVGAPLVIRAIGIFPAIGFEGFSAAATGRLDIEDISYREAAR